MGQRGVARVMECSGLTAPVFDQGGASSRAVERGVKPPHHIGSDAPAPPGAGHNSKSASAAIREIRGRIEWLRFEIVRFRSSTLPLLPEWSAFADVHAAAVDLVIVVHAVGQREIRVFQVPA